MKFKTTVSVVTLLFLLAGAAVVAQDAQQEVAEQKQVQPETPALDSAEIKEPDTQVIAYYFHGTRRCAKCRKIEAYTKEAIETAYADQLEAGSIVWRPINTDEDGNQHFTKDYQLYTRSVVLSEQKSGEEIKWKNLDKVWGLIGDKEAFVGYIQSEVDAFMGED